METMGISFIGAGVALILLGNAGGYGLLALGIYYVVNEKKKKKKG
jgi:hypothetical protein